MASTSEDRVVRIGVLALQGAFFEHCVVLKKLGCKAVQIRNAEELKEIDGLVIPGGESSVIAKVAQQWNLVEPLRKWVKDKKPVFGTCAGMIFLSNHAANQKINGQLLLGGMDIKVSRNHFGRQNFSFEGQIEATIGDKKTYPGVFIRAPGILEVGEKVDVLATLKDDGKTMPVAVQQGHLLATSFHPELTDDYLWHQHFIQMVREWIKGYVIVTPPNASPNKNKD